MKINGAKNFVVIYLAVIQLLFIVAGTYSTICPHRLASNFELTLGQKCPCCTSHSCCSILSGRENFSCKDCDCIKTQHNDKLSDIVVKKNTLNFDLLAEFITSRSERVKYTNNKHLISIKPGFYKNNNLQNLRTVILLT